MLDGGLIEPLISSVLNVAPTSDGDLRFDLRCRSLLGCHPSLVSPATGPVTVELAAAIILYSSAILMEF